MDKQSFAHRLRRFLDGPETPYGFDDLLAVPLNDPLLEEYRCEILNLPESYPPNFQGHYASPEGLARLKKIIAELES